MTRPHAIAYTRADGTLRQLAGTAAEVQALADRLRREGIPHEHGPVPPAALSHAVGPEMAPEEVEL